jgi:hypothetical protein
MEQKQNRIVELWSGLLDFFPIHLLVSHVKFNIVIFFYWLFLFAVINGFFGLNFGVPFLFLSPEYLGSTTYLSFFLLGFSIGGFIMAFHTYSYIRLGPFYPFIATLSRPFFKFCVNNSFIPSLFIINILYKVWIFQSEQEGISIGENLIFGFSLLWGIALFIALSFLYFFPTNKDLYRLTGKSPEDFVVTESTIRTSFHKRQRWFDYFTREKQDQYYYLGKNLKLKHSRGCEHYDLALLNKVFAQNHTNASIFEIALIVSFFSIGFFRDYDVFRVPAAVSIMMLLTIVLMIVSAFFSWFKRWTYVIILVSLFGMNQLSKTGFLFQFQSAAFGLSYEPKDKVDFSPALVQSLVNLDDVKEDKDEYIKLLDNWKSRQLLHKPKLVILNISGGGSRSALWTMRVLQTLDALTNEQFSKSIQMITGASGGMVGASYYRDLMLQREKGLLGNLQDPIYLENMSKDLLNRVAFSISTSDVFVRLQSIEYDGYRYPKDRGHAFEEELISNLGGALSGKLGDYQQPEKDGIIPVMIFSPTIINDGRRLLVSSQHLAFLQEHALEENKGLNPLIDNVEYLKLFQGKSPENIRMTSVLRMNATFPYIMPMVTMPTTPGMQVMDAGIRDNYGTRITVDYMKSLEHWIRENTSGVVIVRIRDSKKLMSDEEYKQVGMFDKLFLPFGNMYGNFPRVQDIEQDALLLNSRLFEDGLVDVVSLNLRASVDDRIALSWHLTKSERQRVLNAINSQANQAEINRLLNLLTNSKQ